MNVFFVLMYLVVFYDKGGISVARGFYVSLLLLKNGNAKNNYMFPLNSSGIDEKAYIL